MAIRLGSEDLLNTMVVAHPASVTQAQIRAIKVNIIYSIPPSGLTDFSQPRFPHLGLWLKVRIILFFMCIVIHRLTQMTWGSRTRMSRAPKLFSRNRRGKLIMLNTNSKLGKVNSGHGYLVHFLNPLAYRDSSWFRRATKFQGARCQGWIRGSS
jgi:hypothetical protein